VLRNCFLGLVLVVGGCSGTPSAELPVLEEADVRTLLDRIAESGECEQATLDALSAALERDGHMEQAASVQQLATLENLKEVRSLARRIAKTLD